MSPGHKEDEKNQQEPPLTEGPSRRKGGPKHSAGRFVKGKAMAPGLPDCGRVTNCPHLSGTEGIQDMQDLRC